MFGTSARTTSAVGMVSAQILELRGRGELPPLAQLARKELGAEMDGRAHEALTADCGTVTPGARHLGQQAVGTQQADAATNAAATPAALHGVLRPEAKQL